MMLRALRISVWSALALLIAGTVAYGWLQRYNDAVVDVAISNHTDTSQVVRLTDGTSGRRLGTYRGGGRATLRMASYRLDVWYRDPTPSERAADRTDSVGVELLAPDGCRLLDASRLTHGSDVMDIGADGSLYVGDGLATGTGDVVAIDDQ